VLALRLDIHVDVAVAGEGGLGEAGDHVRIVQGGAVAAVSGSFEAFEEIRPGGDGLADGGAQAPRLLHPGARGQGLGGDVGGRHDEGQANGKDDLRRLGVDAGVEPGGGGGWSQPRNRPRPSARCPARGGDVGGREEAVAMLVRGQWVTVTIRVTRAARGFSLRGLAVRIIVTDEGEGINPIPAVPDRAVPPRLQPLFAPAGGTGLRLAIGKPIETWHRGRLRIAGDAGRGSTFSVILPAA
jgi:hypothetical protein